MPNIGHVDMRLRLVEKYAGHLNCEASADVILVVDGEKIPAHRFVLAVNSHFFQVLLLGQNFKEAQDAEVHLSASVIAFKILLQYMYTGMIELSLFSVAALNDLLELSHRYGLPELEQEIASYLCLVVDAENACEVWKNATIVDNSRLEDQCQLLIYMTIEGIYKNELNLSFELLKYLMQHRPQGQKEVKYFKILQQSLLNENFCSVEQRTELLNMLDLSKMTMKELVEDVSPSGLVKSEDIFNVMKNHSMYDIKKLSCWSNISSSVSVVKCNDSEFFLSSGDTDDTDEMDDDEDNGWINEDSDEEVSDEERGDKEDSDTEIMIVDSSDEERSILVDLTDMYCFNFIQFYLVIDLQYSIEISKDKTTWVKVIDFFKATCRRAQNLYFAEVAGRYIKITKNTGTRFIIGNFQAKLVMNPPIQLGGLIFPNEKTMGSKQISALIDNEYAMFPIVLNDTDNRGMRCIKSKVNKKSIKLCLKQPYLLSSFDFRLWDYDGGKYSYKVSTVLNGDCKVVSDKSDELLGGWQTVKFSPQIVESIKIKGTNATIGNEIRVASIRVPSKGQQE